MIYSLSLLNEGEENSYEGSNKFKPISLLWMRLISSEVIVMIISAVAETIALVR